VHRQGHRRDGGGPIALRAAGRPLRRSWWWLLTLLLIALATLFLLRPGAGREGGLTVFAAASLRAVTDALEVAWEDAHPDIPLTVATEASNVLAARITEGADADVFLSADEARPAELAEAGHTAGSPFPFARNEVALVAGGAAPIASAADLAEPGTRLVVGGPSTPIGRYTGAAISALAATTDDPATFVAAVQDNIASHEDNVRAALAKVELGEGDAAFVYRTDALGSEATTEIALPPAARIRADYSAVLVSEREAAREFIDWLRGPTAAAILVDAGFEVAP
jgi:molybdate transport system substrate-binding protein